VRMSRQVKFVKRFYDGDDDSFEYYTTFDKVDREVFKECLKAGAVEPVEVEVNCCLKTLWVWNVEKAKAILEKRGYKVEVVENNKKAVEVVVLSLSEREWKEDR
jgi:diphthamide synthase subunit DPH2